VPLKVNVVSPEEIVFEGEAEMVIARTTEGDIAFLTGHAPFLGFLGIGPVTIKQVSGPDRQAAVHGGFVEVRNDRVIILADAAEFADEIDLARAQRAKEAAEARLREHHDAEVEAALRRAHVRIELATRPFETR
jgi:F-type H+-transporting ATPase subunit epsilon